MARRTLTVLVQLRAALVERVVEAVPDVDVVPVPSDGSLDRDLHGEVLLTLPWALPNTRELLARGVRWVHALGTGVDAFPLALLDAEQVLTCSRGASAIPIAEWVLAVMLAFEKRLPDAWIQAPPREGWSRR